MARRGACPYLRSARSKCQSEVALQATENEDTGRTTPAGQRYGAIRYRQNQDKARSRYPSAVRRQVTHKTCAGAEAKCAGSHLPHPPSPLKNKTGSQTSGPAKELSDFSEHVLPVLSVFPRMIGRLTHGPTCSCEANGTLADDHANPAKTPSDRDRGALAKGISCDDKLPVKSA